MPTSSYPYGQFLRYLFRHHNELRFAKSAPSTPLVSERTTPIEYVSARIRSRFGNESRLRYPLTPPSTPTYSIPGDLISKRVKDYDDIAVRNSSIDAYRYRQRTHTLPR